MEDVKFYEVSVVETRRNCTDFLTETFESEARARRSFELWCNSPSSCHRSVSLVVYCENDDNSRELERVIK